MTALSATTAREWYVRIALVITGTVIALPGVIGAISSAGVETLYKTGSLGQLDAALLQHRAVLLAIIGILLLISIRWKHLRTAAIVAALVSNVSFIMLTLIHPASLESLALVAVIDVVLTALLVVALIITRK